MRQFVMLYKMQATFNGHSSVPYKQSPMIGGVHTLILFVRQEFDQPDTDRAKTVAAFHGWTEVAIQSTGLIAPESLNSPSMATFQSNYEQCFEYGDSVVWYP